MHVVSVVHSPMHVVSVVHSRLEATAPWGLVRGADLANESATHSAADGDLRSQFAHFGMVSRGNCWLSVEGIPKPFALAGGDCFGKNIVDGSA